jgi:predicted metal-dependent enzyme (double-stranded beta helix superfamily)
MFDSERFTEACRQALTEDDAHAAVRELVASAVSSPAEVVRVLGEPKLAGVQTLHRSDDLTILSIVWGPGMVFLPHDHRMWAVIGIYGGREENTFYRRGPRGLTRHGAKQLNIKDTIPLGETIIHAVSNPLEKLTAAIHVYGGDFFATPRSEWDPSTLQERPYDLERNLRLFEEANARLRAAPPPP